ncbi:type-F conjugative transfer system mating-pair stabilization protein TraN [Cedecea sp. NFIX57]|uniref:type-F conjugative transfer system mating-pair stabilization protein TraN n=1 Tax=Cedecea sp. NFIX57 TaxID=1566286 RepID=UPI000A0A56C9|nr:type-F conjugative transfer system mating-pair stabilization protein TraN [Cedecea sp. NFIX57]SMG59831.1 conjugal transfer mating pair stabilization protein TraN [Cedecea sp. NFIX57]
MRQRWITAVVAGSLLTGVAHADADHDYRAGADAAHQAQGAGTDALKNARPADLIPGYTASPSQAGYYGGGAGASDKGLKNDGTTTWSQSEAGKAVSTSVKNNPGEKISQDAPFIKAGRDVEDRADTLVGNQSQQCSAQNIARSQFTRYTCERDLRVEQFCTRSAQITGDQVDGTTTRQLFIYTWTLPFSVGRDRIVGTWSFPVSGQITRITWQYTPQLSGGTSLPFQAFGDSFAFVLGQSGAGTLTRSPLHSVTAGQTVEFSHSGIAGAWDLQQLLPVTFEVDMTVPAKVWRPRVAWTENCPFSKTEGALTGSVCTTPGGDRTVVVDGHPYTVHQACWGWRDTYITQSDSPGTCQAYLSNPACQLAASRCAFTSETGVCLHQNATYSCETRTTGQQMICGGEIYCLDGDCDKARNGTNNDFAPAVSQLAALAAAGKDVAALNGKDVKAFTGHAKFCKKFAVGFSNCCQDGGWGQSAGLARCSSEEKALGKAKEDRLTVSVGEFCSKKVLGVCVEKKRGYCQFDSKLAQIVQEQGRAWQLGIGFGAASSPDCRGITVPELQHINFRQLDFSSFTDDLMKNKKIPDNAALLNKAKDQIQQHLNAMKPEGQ